MKEEVRNFFLHRFREPEQDRPELNGIRFPSIGQQQNDMLVGRYHEDEIKMAVWDCGSDGMDLNTTKLQHLNRLTQDKLECHHG